MEITHFAVQNYKSYWSSGEIALRPGFNVIVGENNVGKTALVEALSLRLGQQRHRSLKTLPTRTTPFTELPKVSIGFLLAPQETRELILETGSRALVRVTDSSRIPDEGRMFLEAIEQAVSLRAMWDTARGFSVATIGEYQPGYGAGSVHMMQFKINRDGPVLSEAASYGGANEDVALEYALATRLRERIYAFRAERLHIGASSISGEPTLQPNAANLAQVLNNLQSSNPVRWRTYLDYVRAVLPQITQITVPPEGASNQVVVKVWTIDPNTQRDDLAVSLSECGTGIGQVLAILYVVVNSDSGRAIIIDEPQSFLHPGAVRKLFDILRLYPKHQYIVTTHSPVVVSAANPSTLTLVRFQDGKSIVEQLDPADAGHLRTLLASVGARLSDVFGADGVLWVEGKTEELCFPLIMAARHDIPISAVQVLGVRGTGKFQGRDARATLEIYKRLTHGPRLMPPAVGFVFDRELRSSTDRDDLTRQSQGRIRFLVRRMYENYLLHPEAIASVVNSIDGFASPQLAASTISDWIARNRWNRELFSGNVPEKERTEDRFHHDVDGASLLAKLFAEMSEGRVSYDKVKHGQALTAWICANRPTELDQIGEGIRDLIRSALPVTSSS